ncbi:2-dehydro-3-deoxy-6-phosphogalactonate aldolase [Novosphingobium sp. KN65.2]|uniref:2-dehydro-3-deoxy-6-phosphogalactonate aldolase n=1 Tax=Novosphingobium sp. KN65.2 TaxID=1478134 RepID=UPI0005DC47A9|nr:2-dehydro-3-deoxy-6-phosphogalactonate aldolase [Novosphingobium sp. KN65.2]CDO36561.1 2-dehydro-3-deoxy-6-phosphogalactonate aldolase (6-phospho-2-dehydro-3-deoxygalactonate aldolase) (2-oxo-3-deoxygalactonate 6-phosphate aldolase) [Novosphingobium sp. KN65.2]
MKIEEALASGAPPIAAILRGILTQEAVAIGQALIDAGIRIIEVPFNSPDPADSIAAMVDALGDRAAIGGGTVISVELAKTLAGVGGTFMVSPNVDPEVISRSIYLGMDVLPGFLTPTEAFAAIHAGARDLKLFPGASLGSGYIKAIAEVLPRHARIWAVGGVGPANLAEYRAAGTFGIGVGGSLFKPGHDVATVSAKAREIVAAWNAASE